MNLVLDPLVANRAASIGFFVVAHLAGKHVHAGFYDDVLRNFLAKNAFEIVCHQVGNLVKFIESSHLVHSLHFLQVAFDNPDDASGQQSAEDCHE